VFTELHLGCIEGALSKFWIMAMFFICKTDEDSLGAGSFLAHRLKRAS
jgi:hypothetical protein